ncbi:MAG: N-acetylgalactosamine-6-sulfatase [Pirellulaceae bacterium]|nr:MAG: N-acetylgalactosamine-6-sulfatase [Pirellulaceae bacterium]
MKPLRHVLGSLLCAVVIIGLIGLVIGLPPLQAAPRPHIVFILADDLGYADVGFMGSREIQTPHLDKLAAGGVVLESFYVQPVCSPTRAALLTGRYPTRTGVYTVVRPNAPWGLPLNERTLADALREAGYHTAICGKWHLGEYQEAYRPTRRGFDEQYGHYFGALDYFTKLRNGRRDWYRNDQPCADEGYSTHLLAQEAVRIIKERPQNKPLFLYVPFQAVHAPYQVPESYLEPYRHLEGNRQKYAGMVTAMDEAIGKIVAALEECGMRQDTLIVFSSDNGGPSPGRITDNRPLRAGKGTIYEGGVRVYALANWPGRLPAGRRTSEPIHIVDWYPTLLKLAGAPLEQPLPVDGLDIWPVLAEGARSPHDAILLCQSPSRAAVRSGDWKLIVNRAQNEIPGGSTTARSRATANRATTELYNLAIDISETNNLASQEPDRVAQLQQKLAAFLKDAVKPGNEQ